MHPRGRTGSSLEQNDYSTTYHSSTLQKFPRKKKVISTSSRGAAGLNGDSSKQGSPGPRPTKLSPPSRNDSQIGREKLYRTVYNHRTVSTGFASSTKEEAKTTALDPKAQTFVAPEIVPPSELQKSLSQAPSKGVIDYSAAPLDSLKSNSLLRNTGNFWVNYVFPDGLESVLPAGFKAKPFDSAKHQHRHNKIQMKPF